MNPVEWLERKEPGFKVLPEGDRQAIFHFALLWSLFESKTLGSHCSASAILALVREWEEQGKLDTERFKGSLEYFRQRYCPDGRPTHYFDGLRLRSNDSPDLVRAVLLRTKNEPVDTVAALLIVVYRLRNNLFHGVKWAYGIQGRLTNFSNANDALMNALSLLETNVDSS